MSKTYHPTVHYKPRQSDALFLYRSLNAYQLGLHNSKLMDTSYGKLIEDNINYLLVLLKSVHGDLSNS